VVESADDINYKEDLMLWLSGSGERVNSFCVQKSRWWWWWWWDKSNNGALSGQMRTVYRLYSGSRL